MTPGPPLNKTTWGPGPWQDEPDFKAWHAHGYPCHLRRAAYGGTWCGYVTIPPGHPMYGKDYHSVPVEVHCGLTYGDAKADGSWAFGFDCGHAFDLQPGWMAHGIPMSLIEGATYRDEAYATEQTDYLAAQLAALAREAK